LFTVKRKNPINEPLFTGQSPTGSLNPYAAIIVEEALRRGIQVDVIDGASGLFRLTFGARIVRCRESLSDFTTAVAMSICDDKAVTRRIVADAGLVVPDQIAADDESEIAAFLDRHPS